MFVVAVNGNIGTGKSTVEANLVRALELAGHVVFRLIEDVDAMCEAPVPGGGSVRPLELSYREPHRYKGTAQIYFYALRRERHAAVLAEAQAYQDAHPDASVVVVSERCGECDAIFFEVGREQGHIDDMAALAYHAVTRMSPLPAPDLYVYLRSDPEVCAKRVNARSRAEEDGIPLELLRALHAHHDRVYLPKPNAVVLDNNPHLEPHVRDSVDHPHVVSIVAAIA